MPFTFLTIFSFLALHLGKYVVFRVDTIQAHNTGGNTLRLLYRALMGDCCAFILQGQPYIYMRAVVCVLERGEEGVQILFKGCV